MRSTVNLSATTGKQKYQIHMSFIHSSTVVVMQHLYIVQQGYHFLKIRMTQIYFLK